MPLVTIPTGGTAQIPGMTGRKALCLYVETGDAVFGFEPVSHSGSGRGIPLPPQAIVSLVDGHPRTFAAPVHLASAAGATVLYQEHG